MIQISDNKLIKIGIFYDGNYFSHVSNYYNYEHERAARLSIAGLHDFIRQEVADSEGTDVRYAQIVDAHYFRGRLNVYDADNQNKLFAERIFDDILMSEGVVTHYLPLRSRDGRIEEKGIDVWMALEAYELTLHKKFNVIVMIACDSDYLPLVRKLNALGTRVMVLGWDFEYTDDRTGRVRKTVTSQDLLKDSTYPVFMHEIIDNRIKRNDSLINNLFIQKSGSSATEQRPRSTSGSDSSQKSGSAGYSSRSSRTRSGSSGGSTPVRHTPPRMESDSEYESDVLSLRNGYGFISYPPNNLYFHWSWVKEVDFNDLNAGDIVVFNLAKNDRGQDVAVNVRLRDENEEVEYIDDEEEFSGGGFTGNVRDDYDEDDQEDFGDEDDDD